MFTEGLCLPNPPASHANVLALRFCFPQSIAGLYTLFTGLKCSPSIFVFLGFLMAAHACFPFTTAGP
jgi:hypothetical protein